MEKHVKVNKNQTQKTEKITYNLLKRFIPNIKAE